MRHLKLWFTRRNAARFFGGDFHCFTHVTHDASRKGFLAKMLGLVAVAGLAPRWLAKAATERPDRTAASAPVTIRPDARAVARRSDTI
jgi:hypothetical protein